MPIRPKVAALKEFILLMAGAFIIAGLVGDPGRLTGQAKPAENQEIQAARRIEDLQLRLKELERIKAAYPQSALMDVIDRNILDTRVSLSDTVEAVDALQRLGLANGTGFARLDAYYFACERILNHRHIDRFDPARLIAVIESYVDDYLKAAGDPAVVGGIAADEKRHIATYSASMFIFEARAYLRDGRAEKALAALEKAKTTGAALGPSSAYYSAEARVLQGREADAFEAYFAAAVENYRDSEAKARALFMKLKGSAEGFDALLEEKWRELPFRAGRFDAGAGWTGKTVLAELFTGSECGPCVAADFGFDGLLEAFDPRHLAVLVYHLPIPGPDPLMNPAARKRQSLYGVSSTPTSFFDGEGKHSGGGAKPRSEEKFKAYRSEIEARVHETPAVRLGAAAVRQGGTVTVECSFDKVVPGAAYHIALVEREVRYRGSNGIVFHKMVVRDLVSLAPTGRTGRAVFDLASAEGRGARALEDLEKERSFQFREKKSAIDPARLAVVFFVQDEGTKKVLNAAYAEVK
jgi:hypothetical protein